MITTTPPVAEFDNSRIFIRMTDEELAKVIGGNVRAARTAAGLSQSGLGERTGIAVPNISRLEAGTHLPSVATLKKVSDVLEVPICSLLDPPENKRTGKRPRSPEKKESAASAEEPIDPRRRKGTMLGHEAINELRELVVMKRKGWRETFQSVLNFIRLPESERAKFEATTGDAAGEAIRHLRRIPKNDQLRDRAYEMVGEWIERNLSKT